MDIVGSGFLARRLSIPEDDYPGTLLFVSGASSSAETSVAEFARESTLLRANLMRCTDAGKLFVYFSTASVGMYGKGVEDACEEERLYPSTPYGCHKLEMETAIKESGVDYLILRLTTPVGVGQRKHQFLPAITRQIRNGEVTIQRGAQRDLIDVADVSFLLEMLLSRSISRETINIASGFPASVSDIVDHIENRIGLRAAKRDVDVPAERNVSVKKLHEFLPAVRSRGFGPDYFRRVIDRYLNSPSV